LALLVASALGAGDVARATAPPSGTATEDPAADGVGAAVAAVEAARGEVPYTEAATPFDTSSLAGREVWVLMPSLYPITETFATGLERAFTANGIELTVYDGKFDVAEYAKGVESAVAAGADALILFVDGTLIAGAIQEAADAGLVVIQATEGIPGEPPLVDGVADSVTWDYRTPATLMADWFIADSAGVGHAVLLTTDEYRASVIMKEAFLAEVDRLCPETCEVTVEDVPIADWSTGLQALTQTLLQRDGDITHLLPVFDGMVTFVLPGVALSGHDDDVAIGSFNASANVLAELTKPDSPVKMDIGNSNLWLAYAAADATMRALLGEPAVGDYGIGFRMFDASNVGSIGSLDAESEEGWYGHDYFAEFERLWQRG